MLIAMPSKWKRAAILFCSLIVGLFFSWLFFPPFPAPTTLSHRTYSSLVSELGLPSGMMEDKFVQWSVKRFGVVNWFVEAGIGFPINPHTEPSHISRQLWIAFPDGWRRVFMQIEINQKNADPKTNAP
jgi:hypothetical protein